MNTLVTHAHSLLLVYVWDVTLLCPLHNDLRACAWIVCEWRVWVVVCSSLLLPCSPSSQACTRGTGSDIPKEGERESVRDAEEGAPADSSKGTS